MAGIASAPITLFGVLHLKAQNGGTFGNGFLQKLFTLGWVTGVRMILLIIPCCFAIFALASIVAGEDGVDPAFALCRLGFEAAYYLWLGALFKEANPIRS